MLEKESKFLKCHFYKWPTKFIEFHGDPSGPGDLSLSSLDKVVKTSCSEKHYLIRFAAVESSLFKLGLDNIGIWVKSLV